MQKILDLKYRRKVSFLEKIYAPYIILAIFMVPSLISQVSAASYGVSSVLLFSFFAAYLLILAFSVSIGYEINAKHQVLPLFLVGLVSIILLLDLLDGVVHGYGYKIILLLAVSIYAHQYSKIVKVDVFCKILWLVLLSYVVLTFLIFVSGGARVVDVSGLYYRVDVTGSVTSHAILCALYIMFTFARWGEGGRKTRFLFMVTGFLALYMVFKSGNRQSLVMLFVFCTISMFSLKNKKQALLYYVATISAALFVFFIYTALIDANLFYRLFELDADKVTSGRGVATIYWLSQVDNIYTGLGLGYISAYGQTVVGGVDVFENFPHNEYVRFYIEGGLFGLLFVVLLFYYFFRLCYQVIRYDSNRLRVICSSALFSVVFVSSVLDNVLFDMYKSNLYFLSIVVIWSSFRRDKVNERAV